MGGDSNGASIHLPTQNIGIAASTSPAEVEKIRSKLAEAKKQHDSFMGGLL